MNWLQRYNLFRTQHALTPTRQFKAGLLRKLVLRLPPAVRWYQVSWVRFAYTVTTSFVVVASITTSVYAYNSPTVAMGTPLYPIKQVLEKIEGSTKVTPEQKEQFLLKTMQRREAEKKMLEKTNQDVEATENQIQLAAVQLKQVEAVMPTSTATAALQQEVVKRLENQTAHWQNRMAQQIDRQRTAEALLKVELDQAQDPASEDAMSEDSPTTTDVMPANDDDDVTSVVAPQAPSASAAVQQLKKIIPSISGGSKRESEDGGRQQEDD